MKRKLTLWGKIKIFRKYLKDVPCGLSVNCQYCNGSNIKTLESVKTEDQYFSRYECLDCGAQAVNEETWSKK